MLRFFDYRCLKCRRWTEAMTDSPEIPEIIECQYCDGVAERRWRRAPGVVGDGEYYSDQLRTHFSSKKAFKDHCKSKGLEVLGKEEWHRTQFCMPTGEANDEKKRDEEIVSSMQEAWERTIVQREIIPAGEPIEISPSDMAASEGE